MNLLCAHTCTHIYIYYVATVFEVFSERKNRESGSSTVIESASIFIGGVAGTRATFAGNRIYDAFANE